MVFEPLYEVVHVVVVLQNLLEVAVQFAFVYLAWSGHVGVDENLHHWTANTETLLEFRTAQILFEKLVGVVPLTSDFVSFLNVVYVVSFAVDSSLCKNLW